MSIRGRQVIPQAVSFQQASCLSGMKFKMAVSLCTAHACGCQRPGPRALGLTALVAKGAFCPLRQLPELRPGSQCRRPCNTTNTGGEKKPKPQGPSPVWGSCMAPQLQRLPLAPPRPDTAPTGARPPCTLPSTHHSTGAARPPFFCADTCLRTCTLGHLFCPPQGRGFTRAPTHLEGVGWTCHLLSLVSVLSLRHSR